MCFIRIEVVGLIRHRVHVVVATLAFGHVNPANRSTWMVMMSFREKDSSVMRSFQNFALMLSRSTASNA